LTMFGFEKFNQYKALEEPETLISS